MSWLPLLTTTHVRWFGWRRLPKRRQITIFMGQHSSNHIPNFQWSSSYLFLNSWTSPIISQLLSDTTTGLLLDSTSMVKKTQISGLFNLGLIIQIWLRVRFFSAKEYIMSKSNTEPIVLVLSLLIRIGLLLILKLDITNQENSSQIPTFPKRSLKKVTAPADYSLMNNNKW